MINDWTKKSAVHLIYLGWTFPSAVIEALHLVSPIYFLTECILELIEDKERIIYVLTPPSLVYFREQLSNVIFKQNDSSVVVI
jgi:hypothetical protein